jgi:hypothetical protein
LAIDPVENFLEQRNARANGLLGRTRLRRLESIDLTVEAFRALGWNLLRRSALPAFYCVAVNYFLNRVVLEDFFTTQVGSSVHQQLFEVVGRLLLLLFVAVPLLVIGVSYLSGLATSMVGDWVGGLIPDSDSAANRALQALPKVTGVILRVAATSMVALSASFLTLFISSSLSPKGTSTPIMVLVGLLGLAVAFLLVAYEWVASSLVVPVAMVEGLKGSKAARRSRELLGARTAGPSGYYAVMKLMLTMFFLELALLAGVSTAFEMLGVQGLIGRFIGAYWLRQTCLEASNFALTFCVYWIALTFGAVGRAVVYFERRVQIDGLDVELMARAAWRAERRARFEL